MNEETILTKVEISELNKPNHNGRTYSKETIEKAIEYARNRIKDRALIGCLDRSSNPGDASHIVTDLYIKDEKLYADIEILDTKAGKYLKQWLFMVRDFRLNGIGEIDENFVVTNFTISSIYPEFDGIEFQND